VPKQKIGANFLRGFGMIAAFAYSPSGNGAVCDIKTRLKLPKHRSVAIAKVQEKTNVFVHPTACGQGKAEL